MRKDLVEKMYLKASSCYADFLQARDKATTEPTQRRLDWYDRLGIELEGMYSMLSLTIDADILSDSAKWDEEYYTMKTKVQKDGLELYEKFKVLEKYNG